MVCMQLILQVLLYGALAVVAITIITILVLWRALRRRLRVHPKTASVAPLLWNLPTGRAAQAHRRLRTASQAALQVDTNAGASSLRKARGSEPSEFALLGESIAQQGVDIERDLVNAARTPRTSRSRALAEPLVAVERFEATVAALHSTAAQWRKAIDGPPEQDVLLGVQDRLKALRLASDEVFATDDAPQPLANPSLTPLTPTEG
jgi:hypothetical protein